MLYALHADNVPSYTRSWAFKIFEYLRHLGAGPSGTVVVQGFIILCFIKSLRGANASLLQTVPVVMIREGQLSPLPSLCLGDSAVLSQGEFAGLGELLWELWLWVGAEKGPLTKGTMQGSSRPEGYFLLALVGRERGTHRPMACLVMKCGNARVRSCPLSGICKSKSEIPPVLPYCDEGTLSSSQLPARTLRLHPGNEL